MPTSLDFFFIAIIAALLALLILRYYKSKKDEATRLADQFEQEIKQRGGRKFKITPLKKSGGQHYFVQYENENGDIQTHRVWRYNLSTRSQFNWDPPLPEVHHDSTS